MPKPKETVVAEELPALPTLSLVQLLAHFRPTGVAPVDLSQYLDLVMELLLQDFLNARYHGKPTDEKLVRHLMGYERLRLRREALFSRQKKANPANPPAAKPIPEMPPMEPEPPPQLSVDAAATEVPGESVAEHTTAVPATPEPVAAPVTETVMEIPAEPVVLTVVEASTEISGQSEHQAGLRIQNTPVRELEAQRDWLDEADESMTGWPSFRNFPVIGNPS